uniref:Secreted protein n=1 Tax=Arabidopsis thaliana TaxID=3702 RepID=Q56X56_ARATH|nr:hypothetical protein [Arabidopsis thaliana]
MLLSFAFFICISCLSAVPSSTGRFPAASAPPPEPSPPAPADDSPTGLSFPQLPFFDENSWDLAFMSSESALTTSSRSSCAAFKYLELTRLAIPFVTPDPVEPDPTRISSPCPDPNPT